MPATVPEPTAVLTFTDNHLPNLQKNVAASLAQAGAKVPYQAVKPIHVPDEAPKNYIDQNQVNVEKSIPGSFKSTPETALSPLKALSEHLDYADQLVTGRSHVVGESQSFTDFKSEKEDKRMEYANSPKPISQSPVKKFVDWLHH